MGLFRSIFGAVRYYPRGCLAALAKLKARDLPGFIAAYRESAKGCIGTRELHLKGTPHEIILRNGTSDFTVFCQVLMEEEYRCVPPLNDARVIFDIGANVGLSARYFLRRFPSARVVALEPDPGNFEMARTNLKAFANRCEVMHGALWPVTGQVKMLENAYRDGREWSRQVTSAGDDGEVPSYTMHDLMSLQQVDRIDLLKIDIEGAESAVFAADTSFMDRVRCCAIELHDQSAKDLFREVCDRHGFSMTTFGETTIALRCDEDRVGHKTSKVRCETHN